MSGHPLPHPEGSPIAWPSRELERQVVAALVDELAARGWAVGFVTRQRVRRAAQRALEQALAHVDPAFHTEAVRDWDAAAREILARRREHRRRRAAEEIPQEAAPVIGAALLDEVHAFLGRFVAYPSGHAHVAHALWIAHAHLMEAWESTPRIGFLSPEPASGKTRALEVTELLVPRPVESINTTPSYLFRKVSAPEGPPTLLYDEIDTLFGPKAKDNEEIRGVLNAGHRRGAVAGRCVVKGRTIETEELPAYCAVALAGLGDLPDTLLSRSVIVRMRKRAPGEVVEPFRRRLELEAASDLRARLGAWTEAVADEARQTFPEMPEGIADRDADVWEALLAVADLAGGHWPDRARAAALALVEQAKESSPSLGVQLLVDLNAVFDGKPAIFTSELLEALHRVEEAPWADLQGSPLNARGLAQRLRPYGVRSKKVRIGEATARGYASEDLHDAWTRYLPPPAEETS